MAVVPRDRLPRWVLDVPLAHRGLWSPAVPENSLASFAAARDAGVGVELDVHLSADGVPVVVHDLDLRRVAGADVDVRRALVAELQEHALADGSHVPTLAAALDELGDAPVMVEIKNRGRGTSGLEPAVAAVLARHGRNAYVASFHPGSLSWFRTHAPQVLRAQTLSARLGRWVPRALGHVVSRLLMRGRSLPHLLSHEVSGLDSRLVRRWREQQGAVLAWTVTDRATLATARAGADNVVFEGEVPAGATGSTPVRGPTAP